MERIARMIASVVRRWGTVVRRAVEGIAVRCGRDNTGARGEEHKCGFNGYIRDVCGFCR
jgi:hypothetical protein